jgi:hypothetical protein
LTCDKRLPSTVANAGPNPGSSLVASAASAATLQELKVELTELLAILQKAI